MKIFRKSFLFCFCLLVFFSFSRNVYAITDGVRNITLPSGTWTSNFNNGTTLNYIKNALGSTYSTRSDNFATYANYNINNTSTPIYVYMKNLVFPKTTESITVDGENPESITDKGMLYIISHGYSKASTNYNIFSTGDYGNVTDNNIKQYITQIALWLYMYEKKSSLNKYCIDTGLGYGACDFVLNNSTTLIGDSDVRQTITEAASKTGYNYLNYIIELVDEAKTYSGGTTSSMSNISLTTTPTTNLSDGYVLTDEINPTASGNATNLLYYEVEIEDPNNYGAYITDVNGNKINNTSALTGSFKVYVPISNINNFNLNSIKVTVGGHFIKNNNGYGYTVTDSSVPSNCASNLMNKYNDVKYQKYSNLLLGDFPTEVASTNFRLVNYTMISKVDITDGSELAGATLEVTKKNSDDSWTWVSTNEPHYLTLSDGDYTLCETIPPHNYQTPDGQTECIDFTVDNSKVTVVKMENAPIPDTGIFGSKTKYIAAIILLITGAGVIIYYYKKNKVNNVNA